MSTALIRELFDRIDARDWSGLAQVLDPEIVYERPGYEAFRGIDRLLHFYEHERVIEHGEHMLTAVVMDGDHGACWGRFRGVSRTGETLDEAFADVYRFSDGKIRTRRSFFYRPAI